MAAMDSSPSQDGLTEINITPLVDVFLVLLIIVMVSAHLLDHKALEMQLPKSTVNTPIPDAVEISMDKAGQYWLNGKPRSKSELQSELAQLAGQNAQRPALVSVDEELPYKSVVDLLNMARNAGLHKAALKLQGP